MTCFDFTKRMSVDRQKKTRTFYEGINKETEEWSSVWEEAQKVPRKDQTSRKDGRVTNCDKCPKHP